MSQLTDYIKATEPSCIALWDFGAAAGDPMSTPELISGGASFVGSASGAWTVGQDGAPYAGASRYASISASGNPRGYVDGSLGATNRFLRDLAPPFTWEFLVKLASASVTQDMIGPDANTNTGVCIRTATGHWNLMRNYIDVPITSAASTDTSWHFIGASVDGSNNAHLFIDGVEDANSPAAISFPQCNSQKDFDIAWCNHANNTGASSWGMVAIYNTALTAATLRAHIDFAIHGLNASVDPNYTQSLLRGAKHDQATNLARRATGRHLF